MRSAGTFALRYWIRFYLAGDTFRQLRQRINISSVGTARLVSEQLRDEKCAHSMPVSRVHAYIALTR